MNRTLPQFFITIVLACEAPLFCSAQAISSLEYLRQHQVEDGLTTHEHRKRFFDCFQKLLPLELRKKILFEAEEFEIKQALLEFNSFIDSINENSYSTLEKPPRDEWLKQLKDDPERLQRKIRGYLEKLTPPEITEQDPRTALEHYLKKCGSFYRATWKWEPKAPCPLYKYAYELLLRFFIKKELFQLNLDDYAKHIAWILLYHLIRAYNEKAVDQSVESIIFRKIFSNSSYGLDVRRLPKGWSGTQADSIVLIQTLELVPEFRSFLRENKETLQKECEKQSAQEINYNRPMLYRWVISSLGCLVGAYASVQAFKHSSAISFKLLYSVLFITSASLAACTFLTADYVYADYFRKAKNREARAKKVFEHHFK